jgi:hypothetical protein
MSRTRGFDANQMDLHMFVCLNFAEVLQVNSPGYDRISQKLKGQFFGQIGN